MKKSMTAKKMVKKSDSHTEEIKRYLKELNKDTERYIGAVTEDFQGRVSAIAEQFSGVNERLDQHTRMFGEVNKKLDSHTQMIGRLMVDVQEIKTDLKQKVDRDEFARLEKRVTILETKSFAGSKK